MYRYRTAEGRHVRRRRISRARWDRRPGTTRCPGRREPPEPAEEPLPSAPCRPSPGRSRPPECSARPAAAGRLLPRPVPLAPSVVAILLLALVWRLGALAKDREVACGRGRPSSTASRPRGSVLERCIVDGVPQTIVRVQTRRADGERGPAVEGLRGTALPGARSDPGRRRRSGAGSGLHPAGLHGSGAARRPRSPCSTRLTLCPSTSTTAAPVWTSFSRGCAGGADRPRGRPGADHQPTVMVIGAVGRPCTAG